ncbi:MAG: DNA recombination protein RmuC [Bdellovibrionota bacterium]
MKEYLVYLSMLLLGFACGIIFSYWINWFKKQTSKEIAADLLDKAQESQRQSIQQNLDFMKASFSNLSSELLNKSTEELIKQTQNLSLSERERFSNDLENKKKLIDSQLENLNKNLNQVNELVRSMEKERGDQLGFMSAQLQQTNEQTSSLIKITANLNETLSNSQIRGQWGERIAEDVLKLAGFIENISYTKQKSLTGGSRPDFTFLLPQDQILNMDVKFPIINYTKYISSQNTDEKIKYKRLFLKDVKARIKELTDRGYISTAENTVDCVLLFIPNEQIFAFIQSENPELLDEAIKSKIICCSPLTLFAVLAVVRQAIENFSIEKTSGEILNHMTTFRKQWNKYLEKFENMGKKLTDAQKEYESLASTRTRLLDRSLEKIDKLSSNQPLCLIEED